MIYLNEIDPFCCEWLGNLMDAGEIAYGPASVYNGRARTGVGSTWRALHERLRGGIHV